MYGNHSETEVSIFNAHQYITVPHYQVIMYTELCVNV